jgi:hypothetical protein
MLKMTKIDKERWGILETYFRRNGDKITKPLITGFSKKIVKTCYNALKKEFDNKNNLKKFADRQLSINADRLLSINWETY